MIAGACPEKARLSPSYDIMRLEKPAGCRNSKFTKLNGKPESPEDCRPFVGERAALRFSFSCARPSRASRASGAVCRAGFLRRAPALAVEFRERFRVREPM